MIKEHLSQIQTLEHGMDALIISVSSENEAKFWNQRLEKMRGQVLKSNALLLIVVEDWDKGAGNALGTLYAFSQANKRAKEHWDIDLYQWMQEGKSVALYHTAGKGTRLAPITCCEYNSKSRIQLAGKLFEKGLPVAMTLLEAALKQTSILAPSNQGRLSVFWTDQLFIPSALLKKPESEVSLFISPLNQIPTEEEWQEREYHKYGLIVVNQKNEIKQLEKLSYEKFGAYKLTADEKIALSLGSFSLSEAILQALVEEFSDELSNKQTSLDTDPHLWMPLSLEKELYLEFMTHKGVSLEFSETHYERMQDFKKRFTLKKSCKNLLGATNLGEDTLWWDYGNCASYFSNHLKLTHSSTEATYLKKFFSIPDNPENQVAHASVTLENSYLINCSIRSGNIKNSVLVNVHADMVDSTDSVMINCSAKTITADQALLYHAIEDGDLVIEPHQVRADNFTKEYGHVKIQSALNSTFLSHEHQGETLSLKQIYAINQKTDPVLGKKLTQTMHNKVKQTISNSQK